MEHETREVRALDKTPPERDGRRRGATHRVSACALLVAVAAAGGVIGFVSGTNYGTLFAPEFRIAGVQGVQATRIIGAAAGAALCVALTGAALAAFSGRRRAVPLVATGSAVGLFLAEPLLFSLVPPRHGLLPLAYAAGALIGAAVGVLFALVPRRRTG